MSEPVNTKSDKSRVTFNADGSVSIDVTEAAKGYARRRQSEFPKDPVTNGVVQPAREEGADVRIYVLQREVNGRFHHYVLRDDYDRLQSALTAAQQRLSEQETLLAERNRQNAAAFGERDKLRKLAAFGERCLDAFQDCYSDLDGGWIQDTAVECGVLVEVTATEPCDPEHCECAGMTDFPTKCYRRAPGIVDAAMGAKEGK